MFFRLVFAIAGLILLTIFLPPRQRAVEQRSLPAAIIPDAFTKVQRPIAPAERTVPERDTLARHHPTPQHATGPPWTIDASRSAFSRGNTATRQVLDLVCTACSIENAQSSRQVLDLVCAQPFSG